MSEFTPLISVIIPVKNGAAWLNKTIPGILNQTLAHQTEIIVIDSGSSDNTLSVLSQYPIKLLQIDSAEFNHGTVRNMGAQHARGKYVVMTVQDAEPASKNWLQYLLEGFDDDNVAGVCGQQVVPHETDKNPVDWFRPISKPEKRKFFFENKEAFEALTKEQQTSICRWDNVNAMYQRHILMKIPFQRVSYAEDALWAKEALKNGYAIVYNPIARVYHYHIETPDYTFRRNFTVHYHFYKFFGVRPSPTGSELKSILRNIKLLVLEKKVRWQDKWRWLLFNYFQRRAFNRSVNIFNSTLEQGEAELDKKHYEICGIPPQAVNPGLSETVDSYAN